MRTQVRWSDVDLFGHVNNAAYLRYLDDARFALFDMGVDDDGQLTSSRLVVVKHEIEYLGRLTYRPQPIDVEIWVPRVGRTSVDMAYEVAGRRARRVPARSQPDGPARRRQRHASALHGGRAYGLRGLPGRGAGAARVVRSRSPLSLRARPTRP